MRPIRIGLIGDYDERVTAHRGIVRSLEMLSEELGMEIHGAWPGTERVAREGTALLEEMDGIWCVPASPYRSTAGALEAIRFARESGRPFLGTCGGFQHAVIEYARNVLGLPEAAHEELDPDAPLRLIARLACPLVEVTGPIRLRPGSRVREIVGRDEIVEGYHCNFGLHPEHGALFDSGPFHIVGEDPAGDPRVLEMDAHPFYIATLFQPERGALEGAVQPIVRAFVRACADAAGGRAGDPPRMEGSGGRSL